MYASNVGVLTLLPPEAFMINARYNEQEVGMTGTGYNTTWRTVFIILSCKLTLVKIGASKGTGGLTVDCRHGVLL